MDEEAKEAARRILKKIVGNKCRIVQKGVIIFQDEELGEERFTYIFVAKIKRRNIAFIAKMLKWFNFEEMSELEPKMKNRLLAFLLNEKRLFMAAYKSKDGRFEDFKIR